jgi:hypothetical protein
MCKMKKKSPSYFNHLDLGFSKVCSKVGSWSYIGICLTQQLVMAIQQFLAVKNWKSISQKLLSNC